MKTQHCTGNVGDFFFRCAPGRSSASGTRSHLLNCNRGRPLGSNSDRNPTVTNWSSPGGVLRVTADVNGNLTGTEARSVGGDYADETLSGNWTVSADCTAASTLSFYQAGELVRVSVITIRIRRELQRTPRDSKIIDAAGRHRITSGYNR
jgi:hypothetical protein